MPWTAAHVRRTFLEFFERQKDHTFVASSPCVPVDDPTLLFTNAGMNQFKPLFLGQADPTTPLGKLKRAVNSQKCIRAGGKHNDLEDVGKDTYHHTFFEMLGNWSFGDYFKKEAVEWSWELLTKVYKIPPDRLYATYFGGDAKAKLEPDVETRDLWLKVLPKDHVIPGNMKDNFWMMGDTGPCGPCTEVHVDRIGGRNAASMVNASDPDVIEIWNNVFIQFNSEYGAEGLAALDAWDRAPEAERTKQGYASRTDIEAKFRTLRTLPAKHVDTGMGLERLVSILQNVRSNYDTDVFAPIFLKIEQLTGARAYAGHLGAADKDNVDTAYRVIADHIRTLTFAITDGATPSNDGRGYVLRRILRRAVRYGRQMLSAKPGFFSELVPTIVQHFGDAFPELRKNPARVQQIIREEEESFGRTLDRGIKLFTDIAGNAESGTISGADAFALYDTYGFPFDLTCLMASERGLKVDEAGYLKESQRAKDVSRAGAKADGHKSLALAADQIARLKHLHVNPTDDAPKFDPIPLRAHVKAVWNGHNFDQTAQASSAHRTIGLVLDRTNHYATMGGQEGDQGKVHVLGGQHAGDFVVEQTLAFGGYVLHVGHVARGELRVGDTVSIEIDKHRRQHTAMHHTATHLANLALRDTLGQGVDQKGSLVNHERMRFDFTHNQPVSPVELGKVEAGVLARIRDNLIVHAEAASLASAKSVQGLRAVFGEAYPDPVRVVAIGVPVEDLLANPASEEWSAYSVEFCGGTHVQATGELASFALLSEEAVAKGVRRITAVTGDAAKHAWAEAERLAERAKLVAGSPNTELAKAVTAFAQEVDGATIPASRKGQLRSHVGEMQERVKQIGKELGGIVRDRAVSQARAIAAGALQANQSVVVALVEAGEDRAALQAAVKTVRDTVPRAAVMLLSSDDEGRVAIHASVPDALIAKGLKAGDWLRDAAAVMGGKGGGKPDNAQGGAPDGSKSRDAMRQAEQQATSVVMK